MANSDNMGTLRTSLPFQPQQTTPSLHRDSLTSLSAVCHGLGDTTQGSLKTFVEMLSYRHLPTPDLKLSYEDKWSKGTQGNTRRYDVPIREFDILYTKLSSGSPRETFSLTGPHTFTVTKGNVKAKVGEEEMLLKESATAFVRANVTLELESVDGQEVEIWGAFYE